MPQGKEKILYIGDNLPIMIGMESDTVDLIYTDPPFNTNTFRKGKTSAHSFNDTWSDVQVDYAHALNLKFQYPEMWQVIVLAEKMHSPAMHSYLAFMAPRLVQMHRLLKSTGSLYLHCDPNANYYLRLLLDCVFGKGNFVNEIVWLYKTGGVSKRWFGRKHDTVLFYSKSRHYEFFMQKEKSYLTHKYGFKNIALHEDESGVYREVIMRDVWDIPALRGNQPETTGYSTQKPLALLDRVIKASSNEGDLVMDPFCGCATACVAAAALNRRWIGIDENTDAPQILRDRFTASYFTYNFETNAPADAKAQPPIRLPTRKVTGYKKIGKAKAKLILLQRDHKENRTPYCRGCIQTPDEKHLEVDHILAKDHGGLDELSNFQLLCGNCNRRKGNKDMDFLYRVLDDEMRRKRMTIRDEKTAAE